ncbi:hypothetical protein IWW56_001620 [Coemansia sp. RSA 2131]|nr:hypothetical protein IW147_005725 [Coemansia sp. RSA 720]KAJ2481602.1 hypothetical protein IWW56_001620 [Coemansia sp. RSA 2131]
MKWILASLSVLAVAAGESTVSLRVARDATVSFNGIQCNNDTVPCSSIPRGLDNKLMSFRGNRDYERVLLGFDLPLNAPTKCVLRVPKPIDNSGDVSLTVATTDSVWEEATVNGYTKRLNGEQVGSLTATNGGELDVTDACARAVNHKLSLFVDTAGAMVTFNSLQSGSGDVFVLDYSF